MSTTSRPVSPMHPYAGRFEVFLQATPGLRVEPQLSPFVYAAVGLRYAL